MHHRVSLLKDPINPGAGRQLVPGCHLYLGTFMTNGERSGSPKSPADGQERDG